MEKESNAKEGRRQLPKGTPFYMCSRVQDMREELKRRMERISAKAGVTIADRLRTAYYQNVLRLYDTLPSETRVHSGYRIAQHCSDRQKEILKINQILDYLIPADEKKPKHGAPPAGSIVYALPVSARRGNKGRPVTQRLAAVRALQIKIDTGENWLAIAEQVCDCKKKKHDQFCKETIRQSVIGLQRLLKNLRIEPSQEPAVRV